MKLLNRIILIEPMENDDQVWGKTTIIRPDSTKGTMSMGKIYAFAADCHGSFDKVPSGFKMGDTVVMELKVEDIKELQFTFRDRVVVAVRESEVMGVIEEEPALATS